MSGIHTETVQAKHAYTQSDVPWEQAEHGVMWAHGRNIHQMENAQRQRRFAIFALLFVIAWTILYII